MEENIGFSAFKKSRQMVHFHIISGVSASSFLDLIQYYYYLTHFFLIAV